MLNVDHKEFKKRHQKKINQIIYFCAKTNGLNEKYKIKINEKTLDRMKNYFR